MAFVTAETNVFNLGGSPKPIMLVTGTYTNSAGGTGGIIAAGYTNSSGTLTAISNAASIGGRVILGLVLSPNAADATAPGYAKSYNTTLDADVATIVTAADSTGVYYLVCNDAGA